MALSPRRYHGFLVGWNPIHGSGQQHVGERWCWAVMQYPGQQQRQQQCLVSEEVDPNKHLPGHQEAASLCQT